MAGTNGCSYRRRVSRLTRCLLVVGLCAGTVAAPTMATAAPSGASIPTNWVHHAETPWSWWTPPGWVDAHGTYDLNLSSPTGADWVKFGFSGDPVFSYLPTPRANAQHFFTYLLNNYGSGSINTPGLYSMPLRSDRYTDVSAITVHPPTISGYSNDFRQRATFVGVRNDGVRIRGELVMDYVESVYGDSGIESFQVRSAPRRGFTDTIGKLRKIQHFITYTGSLT